MAKDTQATARLERLRTAVAAWAAANPGALTSPSGRPGLSVGEIVERAPRRDELRLVADLLLLIEPLAERAPEVPRENLAGAVRSSLYRLGDLHPGRLVEVRVPPWAAVQVGIAGLDQVHRRGTPPNVVETDARTWILLADGALTWGDAVAAHVVSASGAHAQLADLLPLP